ncbi:MAG: hypothetical protein APR63_00205 [Desulfuromonas sp. SDB]|nr:MAG: hypothetical protein APR63_00205 [Desulfuromonas sp. SDB]
MLTLVIKTASVVTLLITMIIGLGNEQIIDSNTGINDIRSEIGISTLEGKNIPTQMNYQGYLILTADTTPVTANLDMVFELFTTETGGSSFWSETYNDVPVENGIFNVILGSITPLDPDSFTGYPLWLQTTVEGEVLSPRKKIVTTAYSIRSLFADTADYVVNGAPDNDWNISGNVLYPSAQYGLAMFGNTLHGTFVQTHVNLGNNCITGASGQNYLYCTVGGGHNNTSSATYSTVGGGEDNNNSGSGATIAGGRNNQTSASYSAVGGGRDNIISETYSTIAGGYQNNISGEYSTIGGGRGNIASYFYTTVAGGYQNTSSGNRSTVGGGEGNTCYSAGATISGGYYNTCDSMYGAIGGGQYNHSANDYATIGGGGNNTASGDFSTLGGGQLNTCSNLYSTISGGFWNTSSGICSTIPGGYQVNVSGDYSFAFGIGSTANSFDVADDYDVVFGDGDVYQYQFGINREDPLYPVHVGTNTSNGNGAYLTTGGIWTNGCSRTFKENFTRPDPAKILELVKTLDVFRYNYKGEEGVYHISPVAEDFYELFKTGNDNRYLASLDVSGVALLAIQALVKENEEFLSFIDDINVDITELNTRIDNLTMENQQLNEHIDDLVSENQQLRSELEQMRADIELLKRLNNGE